MQQENIGLFVARAQPGFHIGQIDGIRQAIAQGITKIIVGIGSAEKERTSENPFTYNERKDMVELSVQEFLPDIEVQVYPIPDFGDIDKRKNYIFTRLPDFTHIISGNPRVHEAFKDTGKIIIPIEIRKQVKGFTIRGDIAMGNKKALENVLPSKVIVYLENIGAFQKLREIFNKERKTPSLVVDVVLIDNDGKLILIQRKNFPEGIALPGGFNDYGETGKQSAIREAKEELGVDIIIERELGTWDDPHRDPRGHNVSRAFKGKIVGGILQAADDAKAIIKIHPDQLDTIDFAFPDHKEMIWEALKIL